MLNRTSLHKEGSASVVKRPRPQITVLGARPMSEVGFRDSQRSLVATSLDDATDEKLPQGLTVDTAVRPPVRPSRPPSTRMRFQDDSILGSSSSDCPKSKRQRPVSMFANLPLSLPPSPPKRDNIRVNLSRGKENRNMADAECLHGTDVQMTISGVSPPASLVDVSDGAAPVPKPRRRQDKAPPVVNVGKIGPTVIGRPRQMVVVTSPSTEQPEPRNVASENMLNSDHFSVSPPPPRRTGAAVFPVTVIGKPPPAKSSEITPAGQLSPSCNPSESSITSLKPIGCAKPTVRPKPALKPKPAVKPKPVSMSVNATKTTNNVRSSEIVETKQASDGGKLHLPSQSQTDAAIESTTKTVMAAVQKHTEPTTKAAISAAIAKPGSRTSRMMQPVVKVITKQAYAEAERRVESSAKSTVHSAMTDVEAAVSSSPPKTKPRPRPLPGITTSNGSRTESKWHETSSPPPSASNHSTTSPVKRHHSAKGKIASKALGHLSDAKSTLGAVASVVAERVRHRPTSNQSDAPKQAFTSYVDFDDVSKPVTVGVKTKRQAPTRPPAIRKPMRPTSSPPPRPVFIPSEEPMTTCTTDQEAHGFALYDYTASRPDELSLQAGEKVHLKRRVNDEWMSGEVNGHCGIFPAHFVEVVVPPVHSPVKESSPTLVETGPCCLALYDYESSEVGDLCFSQGDTIVLLEKESDDWLKGRLGSKCGIFPSAFVKVIEDLPAPTAMTPDTAIAMSPTMTKQSMVPDDWLRTDIDLPNEDVIMKVDEAADKEADNIQMDENSEPPKFCIAKHSFSGECPDDLSFEVGDRIALNAVIDSDWLSGSFNGRQGIFPKSFVDMQTSEDTAAMSQDEVNVSTASDNSQNEAVEALLEASSAENLLEASSADASPEETVKALFDFSSDVPGDLCFSAGDVISDVELVDGDWMRGTANGVNGIFPANYVQKL